MLTSGSSWHPSDLSSGRALHGPSPSSRGSSALTGTNLSWSQSLSTMGWHASDLPCIDGSRHASDMPRSSVLDFRRVIPMGPRGLCLSRLRGAGPSHSDLQHYMLPRNVFHERDLCAGHVHIFHVLPIVNQYPRHRTCQSGGQSWAQLREYECDCALHTQSCGTPKQCNAMSTIRNILSQLLHMNM